MCFLSVKQSNIYLTWHSSKMLSQEGGGVLHSILNGFKVMRWDKNILAALSLLIKTGPVCSALSECQHVVLYQSSMKAHGSNKMKALSNLISSVMGHCRDRNVPGSASSWRHVQRAQVSLSKGPAQHLTCIYKHVSTTLLSRNLSVQMNKTRL